MTPLEQLVREAMRRHADEAPEPVDLVDAVNTRRRRRGRRQTAMAVAAVAGIIGASAAIAVTLTGQDQRSAGVLVGDGQPPVPAGMQPVSFHGIQILIPAQWTIDDTECGTPIANTVVLANGAAVETCLRPRQPRLTVAYLTTLDSASGRQYAELAMTPTAIDGHPARHGTSTDHGTTTDVLTVSDIDVAVAVVSADAAAAHQISDSARVVPIDSYGCPDRNDNLTATRRSDSASAAQQLVPGRPSTGVVCRYSGGWLARSVHLDNQHLGRLRSVLNALPVGVSTDPAMTETAAACHEEQQRGFDLRFSYPTGDKVDVFVHLSGCSQLSATNGARTTKINRDLINILTDLAEYDSALPNPSDLQ